jgi:hypothetical protein
LNEPEENGLTEEEEEERKGDVLENEIEDVGLEVEGKSEKMEEHEI